MKILVCGSRDWEERTLIRLALSGHEPRTTTVIHGDAEGADRIAASIAQQYGYRVLAYPAQWGRFGSYAGFRRNIEMLEQQPDLVIAFQLNRSRGTQHTIDQARLRGIPVKVYTLPLKEA